MDYHKFKEKAYQYEQYNKILKRMRNPCDKKDNVEEEKTITDDKSSEIKVVPDKTTSNESPQPKKPPTPAKAPPKFGFADDHLFI